ncbi:DUF3987 domain-containing protein [Blastomonas sp.]|uniref:DUF3987 domain-containing protein n=1 Tax=Blastomonas sp. TaxID=1909299 RepID=UPI00261E4931|nr:DUF3987 domain-containing protein [Blastomonas sp.]MDM7956598.1 DUF3987 domain-containing protein [Blastomonas sp.]
MDDNEDVLPPPGLVGDVAKFIYDAAHRQVPEIALAGAIAFIAGIVGRVFNVSGTGLNHFVLLLAPTGTGKEAINSGISKLVGVLTDITGGNPYFVLNADKFIGPADMASGQGLLRDLSMRNPPSYVAIVGEVTLRLTQLARPNATNAEVALLRALLDLYNKSGGGQFIGATVYSNAANNTARIDAPAFSLVGEGTPGPFYDNLSEEMIANGLLPRFNIIEYRGQRPRRNRNAPFATPQAGMMTRLTALVKKCISDNQTNQVTNVEITREAEALLDDLDEYSDDQINAVGHSISAHLWNRAHKKGLKLAALLAVGCDHEQPIITLEHAQWARKHVERDIRRLVAKFEDGDVGSAVGDLLIQQDKVRKAFNECLSKPYDGLGKIYGGTVEMHVAGIVTHKYISNRCYSLPIFRNDRRGPKSALEAAIQGLIDNGEIVRRPGHQVERGCGRSFLSYTRAKYNPDNDIERIKAQIFFKDDFATVFEPKKMNGGKGV